jgi:long-chain acyl-CoA synthetase
MRAGVQLEEHNVHLCASMLYHRAPLALAIVALNMGHTLVLTSRPDAESILQLIEAHAVTTGFMSPAMFVRLLKLPESMRRCYSTASLKWIMHGGAPCPVEVKSRMIEWWGPVLWDDYGSTESGNVTLCGSHEWLLRPGTVGRPAPGVALKILDADGRELPRREIGLVYVSRGAGRHFEYRGDPEKTNQCHRGEFCTVGDLGYLDEEGYLFLCDRANNMVVSGGTNVYPAEIEQVLVLHPQVADCAVFGVPDELMGEAIVAVVQLMPGASAGSQLTLDILKFLRCRLSVVKLPRKIGYVASIPRDPSGKLRKTRLREEWLSARTNPLAKGSGV